MDEITFSTGVDYIKSLGEDTTENFAELKQKAKLENKTHCIYSIALNGKSLHEGKGLVSRGELAYYKGGTPINHCSAFIVVTSIILSDAEPEYAIKLLKSNAEASKAEKEMHRCTSFNDREYKANIALDLAYKFSKKKKLSREATSVLRMFCISNYNFFKEVKIGASYGTIDDFTYRELKEAFGFDF